MKNEKSQKLILLGILIWAIIQIINHYLIISDFIQGGFLGIAFGIAIIGLLLLVKEKKKSSI